jgi:hypothetical protein
MNEYIEPNEINITTKSRFAVTAFCHLCGKQLFVYGTEVTTFNELKLLVEPNCNCSDQTWEEPND